MTPHWRTRLWSRLHDEQTPWRRCDVCTSLWRVCRMTFDDFCKYFFNMSICHRVNTSAVSLQKRWHETLVDGEWTTPHRAGGCSNNKTTFFNNPQVRETRRHCMRTLLIMTNTIYDIRHNYRVMQSLKSAKCNTELNIRYSKLMSVRWDVVYIRGIKTLMIQHSSHIW